MRINVVLYPWFSPRFLNPQLVTKVSPSDDIEGINNFDIFVIQVYQLPKSCQHELEILNLFSRRDQSLVLKLRVLFWTMTGLIIRFTFHNAPKGVPKNTALHHTSLLFSRRFIVKKVNEIPVTFRYLYSDKIFYSFSSTQAEVRQWREDSTDCFGRHTGNRSR